jgi:hypothetical protein
MTGEKYEVEKLAEIQRDFLIPCQEQKMNSDIIIKIRNGIIVFSECKEITLKRLIFKRISFAVDKVLEV